MSGHGTPRVPPTQASALPPGTIPAPTGFVIPSTEYLASQVLPAAGAFTAAQATAVPVGTKRVSFWITYTQGAAGGYPSFRPQYQTAGGDSGRATVLDLSSFTAANPEGTTKFYLEDLDGPAPTDGQPITYELTFLLPADVTGIDLMAAEKGVTATPGTIGVRFTGDG